MSTATVTYFHSASLRQRFLEGLAEAEQAHRITSAQRTWLQCITHDPDDDAPDLLRVDRLVFSDGSPRPLELAAALMLSHARTDDPRVYLHTLARGLEVFDDRHLLLAALRERFAQGNADTLFEYERIEVDPFTAQMLAIVDQQVEHVGQLTEQLSRTPSLLDASTASLTAQLQRLLPHMPLDPTSHLLQVTPTDDGNAEPDLVVQTLAHAAFDDSCQVNLDAGYERRFLDAQGRLATPADSALLREAFAAAQTDLGACYRERLATFWQGTDATAGNCRAQAIAGFDSSLRRELYDHCHDGPAHTAAQHALLRLLHAAPEATDLRCQRLLLSVNDGPGRPLAATFLIKPDDGNEQVLWFSTDHRLLHFADLAALTEFLNTAPGRDQLRPALTLADQPMLGGAGVLQVSLVDILAPLCADRVDSIIALQSRNLAFALGLPCASEKRAAMVDDALDVRPLVDPRQLAFGSGRWREDAPFDFASAWLDAQVTPAPAEENAQQPAGHADLPPVREAVETATAAGLDAIADEARRNGAVSSATETSGVSGASRSLSASWVEFAKAFDARAEGLRSLPDRLSHCATQALQRYVCVLIGPQARASNLHIQWLESAALESSDVEPHAVTVSESLHAVSLDLVSMLIECVTGHRSAVVQPSTQIKAEPPLFAVHLEVTLIQHMLTGAMDGFEARYVSDFRRSRLSPQRQEDVLSRPYQDALGIREDAMRLDLSLAKRQGRIDSHAMTLARQVLDRPVRSLRSALGVPVVEACSVSLSWGDQPGAMLGDTLILHQPLVADSPVLLWSCEFGWRQFSSVERLQATLRLNLRGENRERWLVLLSEGERRAVRADLLSASDAPMHVALARIDGHVMQAMQDVSLDHQQQDVLQLCKRALRCRLEARLFVRLAKVTEQDRPLVNLLDGLSIRIDNSIFEAMLPPWVSRASIAELMEYYNIFKRYYQTSDDGKDFMFGIPLLQELAHQKLMDRLKQDFPEQAFDPDHITVTSHRYVSALPAAGELPSGVPAATLTRTESLVEYAINRFVDAQDGALSVQSARYPQAAASLTPDYLRALIREVDIGAAYMGLLRKAFMPTDAHYAERKHLFVTQLPAALMAVALPEKVEGRLSERGYRFLATVLSMPDGIAREPLDGTWVILSPLQLVADAGMSPDPVAGVYLICPAAPHEGPVVLYAVYHPDFVFREYASREALQQALRTDTALQAFLLERLDPEVQRRYAHGGFVEPHLPFSVEGFNDLPVRAPGPVTIDIAEDKGNALHTIFTGTLKLLLDMGVSNAVSNAQADRAGRLFLATLALSQALTLLPNKLAALVTLWQSHTLFRASALSASRHRWGRALSEFTAALGVVVTVREQALLEAPPEEQTRHGGQAAEDAETVGTSFSWTRTVLTAEQRARLEGLEARNVELDEMRHDELLNLYFDNEDEKPYAVVAGRVYQVQRLTERGEWKIVDAQGSPGPYIVLDDNQHWQLDLSLRLRGGGGVVTRCLDSAATASAEGSLVVEARGMTEIRQTYRYRARRIDEAHAQARNYLENALDNLHAHRPDGTLDPRVQRIVGDFFGVETPDQALLTRVEVAIKTLLDAMMDASLSPLSSTRIVVGTNRPGRGHVTAFTIPLDPQQRIFLTDRFFRPPRFRLKPEAIQQGFETLPHFQGATLIHEVSHLVLDTKDIAYLESNAPFPDLLRADTAANVRTRAQIERLQDYRLSHRTPGQDLFTQQEDDHWRDVRRNDALGYTSILRITGAKTLNEARTIFLADVDKRSQIMLKNADSVTLMIVRLGRHNYTALNP
ncbi:DUF6543 domain-containing protein [Pseudomonas sp. RC10]|uniref:dermonecrotic toxin domain-containing protein n=1 Tax=Pseudomonas bambusae TaxID=3139142 RepID=UPI0031391CAF